MEYTSVYNIAKPVNLQFPSEVVQYPAKYKIGVSGYGLAFSDTIQQSPVAICCDAISENTKLFEKWIASLDLIILNKKVKVAFEKHDEIKYYDLIKTDIAALTFFPIIPAVGYIIISIKEK